MASPRLAASHPATGESRPPDSRRSAFPEEPTGRPPGASVAPAYTKAARVPISTPMRSSGEWTSTIIAVSDATRAPTIRAISGEVFGKRLSLRLASILKLAGLGERDAATRTAAAATRSMSGATTSARETEVSPNTRARRRSASHACWPGRRTTTRPCGVSSAQSGRPASARRMLPCSVRWNRARFPALRNSSP